MNSIKINEELFVDMLALTERMLYGFADDLDGETLALVKRIDKELMSKAGKIGKRNEYAKSVSKRT